MLIMPPRLGRERIWRHLRRGPGLGPGISNRLVGGEGETPVTVRMRTKALKAYIQSGMGGAPVQGCERERARASESESEGRGGKVSAGGGGLEIVGMNWQWSQNRRKRTRGRILQSRARLWGQRGGGGEVGETRAAVIVRVLGSVGWGGCWRTRI